MRKGRPLVLAAATVLVLAAALTAGADTTADDAYAAAAPVSAPAPAPAPVSAPAAAPAPAPAPVSPAGALFAGGKHFCSASVVHSTSGDLVLTAAHCVRDGMSFAPAYHDGVAPYGLWPVTGVTVPAGWTSSADPDLDFAFLRVSQDGKAGSLEGETGANALGSDRGFGLTITLTGYPDTTDSPVVCTGTTSQSDRFQQRVACPGFPDGTSGGPWVTDVDPATGRGTVIGVIGGYQLGGDTPDVSYSAYFDEDIRTLYAAANG